MSTSGITERADILARAATLSGEADKVLDELGLPGLLEPLGRPVRIGSAAAGLMLLPDIDIGTLCPVLDAGPIWAALQPLAMHPRVKKLRWADERGPFNSTGQPEDEGIYCGAHYHRDGTNAGERWKLDLWFFPEDAPRPEIPLRDRLLAASDEERLVILRLKDAAITAGCYGPGKDVQGIQIYEAVLDHGIRKYDELLTQLSANGIKTQRD